MITMHNDKDATFTEKSDTRQLNAVDQDSDDVPKSHWERSWPTIACGAGLFSDGYLNG